MKKTKHSISGWLKENGDPKISKAVEKELKEINKMKSYKKFLEKKEEEKPSLDRNDAQFNDYPASAKKDAQQALDWKKEHGDEVKAMTAVGWKRANQLASGEKLSFDVISRMAQFKRHQKNANVAPEHKDEPHRDNGLVSWKGWGGDSGIAWAIKKVDELKKKYKIIG